MELKISTPSSNIHLLGGRTVPDDDELEALGRTFGAQLTDQIKEAILFDVGQSGQLWLQIEKLVEEARVPVLIGSILVQTASLGRRLEDGVGGRLVARIHGNGIGKLGLYETSKCGSSAKPLAQAFDYLLVLFGDRTVLVPFVLIAVGILLEAYPRGERRVRASLRLVLVFLYLEAMKAYDVADFARSMHSMQVVLTTKNGCLELFIERTTLVNQSNGRAVILKNTKILKINNLNP